MSGALLDIDPATASAPDSTNAIHSVATVVDDQGVRKSLPFKLAAAAGSRGADTLALGDMLTDRPEAMNLSDPVATVNAAVGGAGTDAEKMARQQEALFGSLVGFLWRCDGHGGMLLSGGLPVLPTAHSSAAPASSSAGNGVPAGAAGGGGAGAGAAATARSVVAGGSVAGGGIAAGGPKRTLDDLRTDLHEELDALSSARGAGLGATGSQSGEPLGVHQLG